MCSVVLQGVVVVSASTRRAKRFGVANLARVWVAMGAWSMLICLRPRRTGVHSSSHAIFGGGAGSGTGVIRTPAGDVGIRRGHPWRWCWAWLLHVSFEDGAEGFNGIQLVVGWCRGHPTYGGVDGLEGMDNLVFGGNVRCW